MLYSYTHVAPLGVKGLMLGMRTVGQTCSKRFQWWLVCRCNIRTNSRKEKHKEKRRANWL